MCFSAVASFSAGAVLSVIGVASIKKTQSSSQIAFASIPLIFAIQQITEGFVWLSLSDPDFAFLQQLSTYNFIFFAQVVWPFWVPFAIIKLVPKEGRRKGEMLLVAIGVLVASYLGYCLLNFKVEATIVGHHITYVQNYPLVLSRYSGLLYVAATVLPCFLSRIRNLWMLGFSIFVSYVLTAIFYTDYVISVWCFFASIISISIFTIIYKLQRAQFELSSSETDLATQNS